MATTKRSSSSTDIAPPAKRPHQFVVGEGRLDEKEMQAIRNLLEVFPTAEIKLTDSPALDDTAERIVEETEFFALRDRIEDFDEETLKECLFDSCHYDALERTSVGKVIRFYKSSMEIPNMDFLEWFLNQLPDDGKTFVWNDAELRPLYTELPLTRTTVMPVLRGLQAKDGVKSPEFIRLVFDLCGVKPRPRYFRFLRWKGEDRQWAQDNGFF